MRRIFSTRIVKYGQSSQNRHGFLEDFQPLAVNFNISVTRNASDISFRACHRFNKSYLDRVGAPDKNNRNILCGFLGDEWRGGTCADDNVELLFYVRLNNGTQVLISFGNSYIKEQVLSRNKSRVDQSIAKTFDLISISASERHKPYRIDPGLLRLSHGANGK